MAHQHYTGTGKMHSFRGLLADGGQARIRIQGATGEIAWRITKLEIFPAIPGVQSFENVVQIWREEQTSVIGTVDFTNAELLGVAYFENSNAIGEASTQALTIFDNSLFSRNIWVTNDDVNTTGGQACNYYIELEEVKVSAAGMAQLAVAAARRTYVPGT